MLFYPECRINISVVFDGFGGPDTPTVLTDILPYTANLHNNSYKEADTFEVSFDAKKFPFSPELIRSAAVEVFLFNKESQTTAQKWHSTDNLVVTGLIDRGSIREDGDGGVVSFSGRDYTALMIDHVWNPIKSGKGGRVPDGELIDVVQQLVDESTNSQLTGRTLTVRLIDADDATVKNASKQITSNKVTVQKATPESGRISRARTRKTRGVGVKADSTYWDVIYKLCISLGYIVYVKNFDVIITKPHVLQALAGTNYRVAYGRNLESLEVERKMAKEAVPQIIIKSYDPKSKTVIQGAFPKDGDIAAQADGKGTGLHPKAGKGKGKAGQGGGFFLTGAGTLQEQAKIFTVPDVKDVKVLDQIARTAYYTLARGEGTIRATTPVLRDLDNQDLLKMRAGDSVEIKWDAFKAEVMMDPGLSREQKILVVMSLGYSRDIAAVVADQYTKLDYFRQPFYVKEVNFTWDSAQGLSIDVEAQNFINPESPKFSL